MGSDGGADGQSGESRGRSVLKSLSWRATATTTTLILGLFLFGNASKAFKVGLPDFLLKLFAFYAHERLWQLGPLRRLKHRRVAKMLLWKVLAMTILVSVAFFVNGDFSVALKLGPADATIKFFVYYVHEVLWEPTVSKNGKKTD